MIKHILLLAKRDFLQRGRSKGFLVMVGLSVVLILAIGPLIQTFADDDQALGIGLAGAITPELEAAIESIAAASEQAIELERVENVESGEEGLERGDLAVLVVDGAELVWADEPRGDVGGRRRVCSLPSLRRSGVSSPKTPIVSGESSPATSRSSFSTSRSWCSDSS